MEKEGQSQVYEKGMQEDEGKTERGPSIIERGSLVAAMLYNSMSTLDVHSGYYGHSSFSSLRQLPPVWGYCICIICDCVPRNLYSIQDIGYTTEDFVPSKTLPSSLAPGSCVFVAGTLLGWLVGWLLACVSQSNRQCLCKKEPEYLHLNVRLTTQPCPFTIMLSLSRDRDGQSIETLENPSGLTS